MTRYFKTIFIALIAVVSCIEEPEFVAGNSNVLENGCLTIEFGHRNFKDITISTRSTVPTSSEDALINIYALIFDSSGKKIYGHFFNSENRKNSVAELNTENCWFIDNNDSGKGEQTWGTLRMKSPTGFTGGEIYLIGNIDPIMLNLSVEKLNLVKSKKDLEDLSVTFNQESTSRTGNLLMIGSAGISIGSTTNSITLDPSGRIPLERIDAKIQVNVAVIPGAVTKTLDKFGNVQTQEVESFTPSSWRVVNLPKDSWILKRGSSKSGGFFDSSSHLFETRGSKPYTIKETNKDTTRTVHGFSFYMLEHQPGSSKIVTDYHQRDKRLKDTEGRYAVGTDGNIWEYAPKDATYLIIEGEVQMKVDDQSAEDKRSQTLNGIVTYYVHLGHFDPKNGGDLNNYDVHRNTHYTYNINITGVNSIEMEVTLDNSSAGWNETNEKQSGATGDVYIAQEEIYTFDAHYGQRVFRFNFDAILTTLGIKVNNGIIEDYDGALDQIADELTWYISSPFGREGTPDRVNGDVEVANGLDYKWVHFLKNDMIDGVYDTRNQWYPGDQYKGKLITADIQNNPTAKGKTLMDVSQLCNYLRQQIARAAMGYESDFDDDRNIYFTAFVDEYYYDKDPISEETRPALWHEFVNKPLRMMHILCSAEVSRDEHSSATGSVVTIRQRAIQTVYNTETATEGWGCETVDEIRGKDGRKSVGFYYRDRVNVNESENGNVGNTSQQNGLYNSVRLWKLVNGSDFKPHGPDTRWNKYLKYERNNDFEAGDVIVNFMNDDYETLRYSCMMRNRDNDGNGYIDTTEVKWYLASTEQLVTLFIGDLGLSSIAQLYNLENPDNTNYISHVVSSTAHTSSNLEPQRVWAEEGCSISEYYHGGTWAGAQPDIKTLSVRCVRDLGRRYNLLNINSYPPPPIKAEKTGEGTYSFDLTNLNDASKRISVEEELVPLDEYSEMSRLSNGFETGPLGNSGQAIPRNEDDDSGGSSANYITNIKDYLIQGHSYCPEGYRMPNIREAAVMYNYIDTNLDPDANTDFWGSRRYAVCTYYHFGYEDVGGKNYDAKDQVTWFFSRSEFTLDQNYERYVRCVRDI